MKFSLFGIAVCATIAATITPATAACTYPQLGCPISDSVEDLLYLQTETLQLAQLVPSTRSETANDPLTLLREYKRDCKITWEKRVSRYNGGYYVYYDTITSCFDGEGRPRSINRMTGQSFLQSAGDGHTVSAGNSFDTTNHGKSVGDHVTDKRYVYYVMAYANLYAPAGYTWEGAMPGCSGGRTSTLRCAIKSTNFK